MYELGIKRLWFITVGFIVALVLPLFELLPVRAADSTLTWDGDDAGCPTDNFNDVDCWVEAAVPVTGDTVVFNLATADYSGDLNNDLAANLDLEVQVTGAATTAGETVKIIGAVIDLRDMAADGNGQAIEVDATNGGGLRFDVGTTLIGNVNAASGSGGVDFNDDLTLSGASSFTGGAAIVLDTAAALALGANDLTINSGTVNISGAITGTGTITITAATLATFGGVISSTGGITITAGTVSFSGGISAGAITQNGGTVTYGNLSTTGAIALVAGTATVSGTMTGATGNVTVTAGTVNFDGIISKAAGNFVINGGTVAFNVANTFGGNVTLASGASVEVAHFDGLGDATGTTTAASGSQLMFTMLDTTDVVIDEDITFAGPGLGAADNQTAFYVMHNSPVPDPVIVDAPDKGDIDFTGTVALTADSEFYAEPYYYSQSTFTFADLDGVGFELAELDGSGGTLVKTLGDSDAINLGSPEDVAGGSVTTDQSASDFTVWPNSFLEVNAGGIVGDVTVLEGGVLTGLSGTSGVTTFLGGTFDPGNSPGCFDTGNLTMDSGSSLDVEFQGTTACSGYDQIQVTGTVDVTDASLSITHLGGFEDSVDDGDAFIIIDNNAADTVTGAFTGLAQGATTTVDGITYQISYTGGTGNDVVLTAQVTEPTPDEPDTGFGPIKITYITVFVLTTLASGALFTMAYLEDRKKKTN